MTSPSPKTRRVVLLTEGFTEPIRAKTAVSVIRYGQDEVLALLDSTQAGSTAGETLGMGGDIPVVARLSDAPGADTLLIGIAPSGGRVPPAWRTVLLEAISRGMDIVSGLHEFLSDDPELAAAAREHGVQLIDVRKNNERDVANRLEIRDDCLRVLTVGQDCSVGKMIAAVEVARGLVSRGHNAKFVATGQTGIMIEGDGCPVDCVVSDFLNGAVEKLVLANQHHDILLVEGQGSLTHPRYSPVTLGLLHGSVPQAMILCYEAGRPAVSGMDHMPLLPLARLRELYESMGSVYQPSQVIAVAINGRRLNDQQLAEETGRVQSELNLPACDVFRHGPDVLIDAVLEFRKGKM